ncbi:MAG: hypothetical protein GX879_05035 [Bacteroidales bacterium]|nr:hypothetical protein [Bacteroidales bacterium]
MNRSIAVFYFSNILIIHRGGDAMKEVRNANKKRIGDISQDGKTLQIIMKGFPTTITANSDGTLNIIHQDKKVSA